jgi:hypothetical protein
MMELTAYDRGYASIDRTNVIGENDLGLSTRRPSWGSATIRLHLGWLSTQLQIDPTDQFRWGRYDALCDLLALHGPVLNPSVGSLFLGLCGSANKAS